MTPSTDPLNIDLRAFKILQTVHKEGSFTRAAEELKLNQSGVSYAIDKLRKIFGDPLFVRENSVLQPTERCVEVLGFSRNVLDGFQCLQDNDSFDPARSNQKFIIACNFYERVLIIPQIVHALKSQAPYLSLEVIDAAGSGADKLLNSEADLLLGPFKRDDAAFYTRTLYTDKYVCLFDPAHPSASRELTVDEYLALNHIQITYGGRWKSNYLLEIERQGRKIDYALSVPSPAGIEQLVLGSDFVATVPGMLARQKDLGLKINQCPVPAPFSIQMIWTGQKHKSKVNKWVRDLIAGTVSASSG